MSGIQISNEYLIFIYLFIFCFLLHRWHMEVSRLGGQLELQLSARATGNARSALNLPPTSQLVAMLDP